MMQITMMNAGAENGVLLLQRDDRLVVQAVARGEEVHSMLDQPLENYAALPRTLLNYVKRTQEPIVLDHAATAVRFGEDPYIRTEQTKSVLCNPIVLLNRLYGILYLENNLSVGAFTAERLRIMSLLSSQMAISLQNALLYAGMEEKVTARTLELSEEKQKSDELLHNILPEEIADELKQNGIVAARQFERATVLFSDFVNFTQISETLSPAELVAELNRYFTGFDAITERHGLEKIKTIGDAYLAVCGIPNALPDHAARTVRAALDIRAFVEEQRRAGGRFSVRIGINSGPVVAGIVGARKFAYDIWGDTVNVASRLESNCPVGKINIGRPTYTLVRDAFTCTHRGQLEAKNKGLIDMYFVEG